MITDLYHKRAFLKKKKTYRDLKTDMQTTKEILLLKTRFQNPDISVKADQKLLRFPIYAKESPTDKIT